ncbi:hypothetical protein DL96DRAFT_1611641 [Flagelloscypha sp. PMI_526]|nr:hypothetical protein DL96DRAFT_1611641 [Flagelloscypha sp. PMI_526]
MPPREIPGFYYDAVVNRYFPLGNRSKPPVILETAQNMPIVNDPPPRKRKRTRPMDFPSLALTQWPNFHSTSSRHAILARLYASTSKHCYESVQCYGQTTQFQTLSFHGLRYQLLGDNTGWLYSRVEMAQRDDRHPLDSSFTEWNYQINSQRNGIISSISTSGSVWAATSMGQTSKLILQDLACPDRTEIIGIPSISDVRCSSLDGKKMFLGSAGKAVYFPNDLLYTGLRNGTISRFDTRIQKPDHEKLLSGFSRIGSRFANLPFFPIIQLFAGWKDGYLASFDVRFLRDSEPIRTFSGHQDSIHLHEQLGFVVDTDGGFLFAAGSDCRLRGWSLTSGDQLLPPQTKDPWRNPFTAVFSQPPSSLHIVNDAAGIGSSLWIGRQRTSS